ncbi:MAG: CPBP family intramembrane metalloprotease [Ktedonobacteraceae bacterium]|nr:CPBP family intramembrane metalloprotease [Ktedonobacteraceae bacterium]
MASTSARPVVSSSSQEASNVLPEIQRRIGEKKIGWNWPLIMAFIRFPLALLGALLTFVVLTILGNPYAYQLSFLTSTFYFTFVNLVSLLLLYWLTQREGIRLRDLIGFRRERLLRDILLGLLWSIVLYIPFAISVPIVPFIVYGTDAFKHFAEIFSAGDASLSVPLWLALWSMIIFPLVNAPVEEMHYRGYVQARLVALSGSALLGMLITTLGFALQHTVFAPSLVGSLSYLVCFFFWGAGAALIYHWQKRLPSLIVAHFITNFFVGLAIVAGAIFR